MPVNACFRARVGRWPEERRDDVLAALGGWVRREGFAGVDVIVDVVGGGPSNPTVEMVACTPGAVMISRFGRWADAAEQQLRGEVAAAGGEDVSLTSAFPDEGDTWP